MTRPLSPGPRHCALRLRASLSQLARELRGSSASNGISVAKLSVLRQLHRHGSLTPSALARLEGVKLQSLTRLLAELEESGDMSRAPHPADGRQTLLAPTSQGMRNLTADVQRREASLLAAIESALSASERAQLLAACALLDRVSEAVARPATGIPRHAPALAGNGRKGRP